MQLYKVAVTVPEVAGDMLRNAIGDAGGGKVGNYAHCSFTVKGTGRFIPQDGAQPAIGTVNKLEEVTEERIEINCDENSLQPVIAAILANHPYETPIIDVYPLFER
jgi:hypothetical protein